MKPCHICNDPIYFKASNNQILCGKKSCRKTSKLTSQRTIRQRRKMEATLEGKVCKRCKNHVYEEGMKKYCKSCSVIMNTYQKKEKVMKICKSCDNTIIQSRTYCDVCREDRKQARILKQTADHKVTISIVKKENGKGINPYFLKPMGSKRA